MIAGKRAIHDLVSVFDFIKYSWIIISPKIEPFPCLCVCSLNHYTSYRNKGFSADYIPSKFKKIFEKHKIDDFSQSKGIFKCIVS